MAFYHVRITLLDQTRQAFDRSLLGFCDVLWIDNDQFFPTAVIGKRDAHDMIGIPFGKREHFELHPLQLFERKIFEQSSAGGGEIMLNRIRECEEIAAGILQAVTQRDQFLPTVDRDQPTKFQIAF